MNLEKILASGFLQMLDRIDPRSVIREKVKLEGDLLSIGGQEIDLSTFRDVVLIGFGKASLTMGFAVEDLLGGRISRGLLVCDRRHKVKVSSEVIVAGHPVPDRHSLEAGERIISMVQSCGNDSLIVFLVSGGGSALVELPISEAISLEDLREMNRLLVSGGATISEINAIRKQVSRIKGGRLGRLAKDVSSIGLFISDVNPGDMLTLASNPLYPEPVDRETADEIVRRYDMRGKLPLSILDALEEEKELSAFETGWRWREFAGCLLMDNHDALDVTAQLFEEQGMTVEIVDSNIEGHYRSVADDLLERLVRMQARCPDSTVCLISGGEASCPVRGDGFGGRNQEFVLYCAARLAELNLPTSTAALSCGTDGIDGNSNAAGAAASPEVISSALHQGINLEEYFQRSDSHSFFKRMGGLICTGPAGNNVRDVRILISRPDRSEKLRKQED